MALLASHVLFFLSVIVYTDNFNISVFNTLSLVYPNAYSIIDPNIDKFPIGQTLLGLDTIM